jgi:hypothetical protein
VIWVRVAKSGVRMPLDATPTQDGLVVLDGPQGTARALKKGESYEGLRYASHHATCPDGSAWRGQIREQLRLDGCAAPSTTKIKGAAAAAGYAATTLRVWTCPGCKQLRSGPTCKHCREARPRPDGAA